MQPIRYIYNFLLLGRPNLLAGPWLAYAVGTAIAWHETGALNISSALWGLLVLTSLQLMGNYINEVSDLTTDRINTARTRFSGGSGLLVSGTLPHSAAWLGAALFTIIGIAVTAGLFASGTINSGGIAIVLLAAFGAYSYSAAPLRLSYRGSGEITVAAIGALLTPLWAHHLQTGRISIVLIGACIPYGVLIVSMLLGVELPDYEADRTAGKRNLVVRLGPQRSARLYMWLMVAGYLGPLLVIGWGLPWQVVAAQYLTLPLAIWSARAWASGHSRRERVEPILYLTIAVPISVAALELGAFLIIV